MTSALLHTVHSKVRRSCPVFAAGSIRASVVGAPHFEHGGRYGCTWFMKLGSDLCMTRPTKRARRLSAIPSPAFRPARVKRPLIRCVCREKIQSESARDQALMLTAQA